MIRCTIGAQDTSNGSIMSAMRWMEIGVENREQKLHALREHNVVNIMQMCTLVDIM